MVSTTVRVRACVLRARGSGAAPAAPGEHADVELLHVEAIRHVVALRPSPPLHPTLDGHRLFNGGGGDSTPTTLRLHPALIVDDEDQEALRRAIDAYFERQARVKRAIVE